MIIKKQIKELMKYPQYAFGILGEKGFGKSSIVKECCRDEGIEYIDIRLSTITEDDLGGLPRLDKNNQYYEYKAPKWAFDIINNPNKQYMILFDEFNQAAPEVLNALFDIVLGDVLPNGKVQRRIANITLPDNLLVCLLGNEEDDNPYITEIPPALKERVIWIPLSCNLQDYKRYFINKYKGLAEKFFEEFSDVYNEINPRNVERILNLVQKNIIKGDLNNFIQENFINENNSEYASKIYLFMSNENSDELISELQKDLKEIENKKLDLYI